MYYDFEVKLPEAKGKYVYDKRGDTTYVKFEYDRIYDPKKQITYPQRITIGKLSKNDQTMIQPNQSFRIYFPSVKLPIPGLDAGRCTVLHAGAFIVLRKIIKDYKLDEMLWKYFDDGDLGLFLDLAAYSIISEDNAAQYYPTYASNHPLFTQNMKIYSDSTISDFLSSVTPDQSVGFLNEWNASRNHREKIYISYDSTNKNSQAGDVEFVEYGKPKVDMGFPVFNYAMGYDVSNREPLFYEKYQGSIVDVSQLKYMLEKAHAYGYKKVGFILDRGYFSKQNINYMDDFDYSFVIMVKGMADLVSSLILANRGSFEELNAYNVDSKGIFGKTIKRKLYATDTKERYFHLYFSPTKYAAERTKIVEDLESMWIQINKYQGEEHYFASNYSKYFNLHYDKEGKVFLMAEENAEAIHRMNQLCGYFVIVTSDRMTAEEAYHIYKSRDMSEKVFRGDKSYLGDKSMRTYSSESTAAKIFIEFVAMIIRNKVYTCLVDEMKRNRKKSNYMTVPAAIKELEKIELSRQLDDVYRLDHAVSANQKAILEAFGMTEKDVESAAASIGKELKAIMEKERKKKNGSK